jgi:DNA-binding winged helix-turn-helix (wHTH) protein/Tol biopolymer transport system component
MTAARQYTFGPFLLDGARRALTRDQQAIPLTARAFDVLLALVERAQETVDKDELLRIVWPDTIVEEANLSQQIFTIRKLLGHTEDAQYIATVPRRGYRFVVPVLDVSVSPPPIKAAALAPRLRLAIPIPAAAPLASSSSAILAVAPDGGRVVYVAQVGTTSKLCVRPLDTFDVAVLEGTEGAVNPVFSPDGHWLAFQAGHRLLRIPISGGPASTICEVEGELRGAAWTEDDTIVFAPGPASGLRIVAAAGGHARPLTTLRFDEGERTHRWPHTLPGGDVVFTIGSAGAGSFDEAALAMVSRDGAHRVVVRHATDGRTLPDGQLAWIHGGVLLAAPFDRAGARLTGPAHPILAGVAATATGNGRIAWSSNGVLVHVAGEAQSLARTLVAVNRRGAIVGRHAAGNSLEEPRLSADGRSALAVMRGQSLDVWMCDIERAAQARVTFEGENFAGIWAPDGAVTYSSSRGAAADLYSAWPDRAAAPECLIASEFDKVACSWSRDGRFLLFTEYHPDTGADLWCFDRREQRAAPFVRTRFNEYAPAFSPDGSLVAYTTDESGSAQIQVVSFPGATGKRQLSTDGGSEAVWSRDGRELFYRNGDRLMRVDMSRGSSHAGVPATLFEGKFVPGAPTGLANYDISPDGETFYFVVQEALPAAAAILVTIA